jgi:hypothetical protein
LTGQISAKRDVTDVDYFAPRDRRRLPIAAAGLGINHATILRNWDDIE